jgi:hypothetical protein
MADLKQFFWTMFLIFLKRKLGFKRKTAVGEEIHAIGRVFPVILPNSTVSFPGKTLSKDV